MFFSSLKADESHIYLQTKELYLCRMETKLFDSIIFGPIKSRRLGVSLGINLLPTNSKLCNFDCIYCECGWTDLKKAPKFKFHSRKEIKEALEYKLQHLLNQKEKLCSITFAGNGEPTLHPEFEEIINDTIELRDKYYPNSKISVLSNSLMLNNSKVVSALKKVDKRILKLDAGTEDLFQKIDQPLNNRTLEWVVYHLNQFNGDLTIQTMFLKGLHKAQPIDNTTDYEVDSWLELLKIIKPKEVMLYSLDRPTPETNLEKISFEKLQEIGKKVEQLGIKTLIY